jgi:hypothetical protein
VLTLLVNASPRSPIRQYRQYFSEFPSALTLKAMKDQRTIKLFAGALYLALSAVAQAGTIGLTLDGNFAAPDYAFYSYTDVFGQAQNDIPVGPYITSLTGGPYNNTLAYTFCYDFFSPTDVGTQYFGTIETLTDTATLESTYLLNQLNILGLINAPLATRGAISMAVWEIMNASSTTGSTPFPSDPAAQPWEAAAAEAVSDGSWTDADSAQYPTWVPDDPAIQRFGIVIPDLPEAPEPASLALMGLALLGLGFWGRKKNSKSVFEKLSQS